jgi:hypothetical protein
MDAREDGQDAHPERACTSLTNVTSQGTAPFERRLFWLLFWPVKKVTRTIMLSAWIYKKYSPERGSSFKQNKLFENRKTSKEIP